MSSRPLAACPASPRLGAGTLAVVGAWLALGVAGFAVLLCHQSRPGSEAVAPVGWPAGTTLARSPAGATLLLFLHPRCPCSQATLSELERLLARAGQDTRATVVFLDPSSSPVAWSQTGLRRRAESLVGVSVRDDPDGAEASRFGATTSGTLLLYDGEGCLQFRGGITAGRGHEGDNAGTAAVAALLTGKHAVVPAATAVFGCALCHDTSFSSAPGTTGRMEASQ